MPISSQFALSLELSRLVPLGLIGSKAAEAVMSLARNLQNSGSDIVVEEDLANLFGRNRIAPQFETSFKTAVAKSETTQFFNGIQLQDGAGPTVVRSFQNNPYFSTVVQCSLLAFYHERWSLAGVLHQIMERQMEGALDSHLVRAPPSQEGLSGFLEACVNQTAGYDWWGNIEAVAAVLNNPYIERTAIPPAIVRGAVYMFGMVQSLPDDRLVVIHTYDGIYPLVVWAHHVLGLTVSVTVRGRLGNSTSTVTFGKARSHVIIEHPAMTSVRPLTPSITLMECSDMDPSGGRGNVLFKFSPDPDEESLFATALHPARGLAQAFLRFQEEGTPSHSGLERHLCKLAAAWALRLSQQCVFRYVGSTYGEDEVDSDTSDDGINGTEVTYHMNQTTFLVAVRVLCGDDSIQMEEIKEFQELHLDVNATDWVCAKFTHQLIAAARGINADTGAATIYQLWFSLRDKMNCLAAIMLAFAHIKDLANRSDVFFSADYRVMHSTKLATAVLQYKIGQKLELTKLDILGAIQTLALGSYGGVEDDLIGADVFSCHGWSYCRDILGPPDPSLSSPFGIEIRRGTPCRNGVYRRAVVQGPLSDDPQSDEWLLENLPGEDVALTCANAVNFAKPIIGDRRESFVINLRLEFRQGESVRIQRTGYRELQEAVSMCERTRPCHHHIPQQQTSPLLTGCRSFSDFASLPGLNTHCRVALLLTADNGPARWRALIAATKFRERRVLLRGRDCCLDCTMLQAVEIDDHCFVVL